MAASSSGDRLHVVPFPGTPDAAADSEVIFWALAPSDLEWVSVRGSRSGFHSGHLAVLPASSGTAFAPDRPFAPGEVVRVRAGLSSPTAGTAAGAPGASRIGFSFTVAQPAPEAATASAAPAARTAVHPPRQHFRTAPKLRPPLLSITKDGDPKAGDIFLATNNMPQVGPMIINGRGQLLWYQPFRHGHPAYNFRVQTYRHHPVLTFWQGTVEDGHGTSGRDVILNHHYQVVKSFHAGHGYVSDLHEFQITPQGTALIDSYVPVQANLTSVGGSSSGTMLDCVIQELDISTGQVLWEWHMLGHIPVDYTYQGRPGGSHYDPYHLNSIQQLSDGNLLVSARNTWAVYEISKSTGQVIWELGGKHPSFHMGQYTNFEWQHDARLYGNVVSVFDDAALPQEEPTSVAKEIALNTSAMTATMIHTIRHKPPLLAGSLGNVQHLRNNNLFVGWGSADSFSEYTLSGRQVFNGSLPLGVNSYRSFRLHWTGAPRTRPAITVSPQPTGHVRVYASWNGATRVVSWRVLGGARPGSLSRIWQVRWRGFETEMRVPSDPSYLAVEAIGPKGHVLGSSAVHAVHAQSRRPAHDPSPSG